MNRVSIGYRADEWDGRTMEIVIEPAADSTCDHFDWVRGEARDEVCHARSVGVQGGAYEAPSGRQEPRDWLLARDQVEYIRVDRDRDRAEPVIERPDLFDDGDSAAM